MRFLAKPYANESDQILLSIEESMPLLQGQSVQSSYKGKRAMLYVEELPLGFVQIKNGRIIGLQKTYEAKTPLAKSSRNYGSFFCCLESDPTTQRECLVHGIQHIPLLCYEGSCFALSAFMISHANQKSRCIDRIRYGGKGRANRKR